MRPWSSCLVCGCLAATAMGCLGDDNDATGTTGGAAGALAGSGGQGGRSGNAGAGGVAGPSGIGGSAGIGGDIAGGGGDGGFAGSGGGGGSGGDIGAGGVGGSAGSGGTDGTGGTGGGGGTFDAGNVPVCNVAIVTNTYDATAVGCNGIATCRGIIAYVNNSGAALAFPMIRFSVPEGVLCTKTHSTSKWVISDDGFISHKCAITTNPATPWNVAPGNTFRFGYDVTAGVAFSPPTDITISDTACVPRDAGVDAAEASVEAAADALPESASDASTESAADAIPESAVDAPADISVETSTDGPPDAPPETTPGAEPDGGPDGPSDAADGVFVRWRRR